MPITKSAKKSLKVSQTKRSHNKKVVIELDKALKKASATTVSEVISKIDKAAKTDVISKNKAARLKSRLTKKFGTPKVAKAKAEKTTKVQSSKVKGQIKSKAKKSK